MKFYIADRMLADLDYILNNTFVTFGDQVYRQTLGVPMGFACSPMIAVLMLCYYELRGLRDIVTLAGTRGRRVDSPWGQLSLARGGRERLLDLACRVSRCARAIDDVLFIDLSIAERDWVVQRFYPVELELKEVCRSPNRILYLDMEIRRDRGGFYTTLYDKRDELASQGLMGKVRKWPCIASMLANRCKYGTFTGFLHRVFRIEMRVRRFVAAASHRVNAMASDGYLTSTLLRYCRRFLRAHYTPRAQWQYVHSRILRRVAQQPPSLSVPPPSLPPPAPTPSPPTARVDIPAARRMMGLYASMSPPSPSNRAPPPTTRVDITTPLRGTGGYRIATLDVGRLTQDDRGGFEPVIGGPQLWHRWRHGELQILATRETWLGNGFKLLNQRDVSERRHVCELNAQWRNAHDADAARAITQAPDVLHLMSADWLDDSAWDHFQRAFTQLVALTLTVTRARLMCWCRTGHAGAWQPQNRCHCDGLAADAMRAAGRTPHARTTCGDTADTRSRTPLPPPDARLSPVLFDMYSPPDDWSPERSPSRQSEVIRPVDGERSPSPDQTADMERDVAQLPPTDASSPERSGSPMLVPPDVESDVADAVRELMLDALPGSTVVLAQIVAQVAVARYLRDASDVSPSTVRMVVSSFEFETWEWSSDCLRRL